MKIKIAFLLIIFVTLLAACGAGVSADQPIADDPISADEQPAALADCDALKAEIEATLNAPAVIEEVEITDNTTGQTGPACQITLTGTGETFGNFLEVAAQLDSLLTAQGWAQDIAFLADGPTGTAAGYRLDEQLALVSVDWEPTEEANCPADEPIVSCELTPAQQAFTITVQMGQPATN